MTPYHYPFESEFSKQFAEARAKGVVINEWHQPGLRLQEIISHLEGPILEIGGPSDQGYYFLHDVELPSRVIISNVTNTAMRFAPNAGRLQSMIEKIIDGRKVPYQDNSLGMVLSSHLSRVDEPNLDFSTMTDEQQREWSERLERCEKAIKYAADTGDITKEELKLSLRFGIACEVWRALKPGGIYMTDATDEEIKVYERIGFTTLAYIDRLPLDYGTSYYDVVFRKPQ